MLKVLCLLFQCVGFSKCVQSISCTTVGLKGVMVRVEMIGGVDWVLEGL